MKIGIIGGGAAGIFLALLLKDFKGEIVLFEKNNEIGKKLALTGGGRMNIGNKNFGVGQFFSHEKNILKNIFKNPEAENVMDFFEEIGTEFVWENNRAILKNQNAKKEVERFFETMQKQKNLILKLGTEIETILKTENGFKVNNDFFDKVVIASGGVLRIGEENSKEESYEIIKNLGHDITPIEPALGPLIVKKDFFKGLEGLAIEAKIRDKESGKSCTGEVMFTHNGISGPAVLDFSLFLESDKIKFNFLPNMEELDFRAMVNEKRKGRTVLRSFLHNFLPKRMVDWHLHRAQINPEILIADLKKEELNKLIQGLYFLTVKNVRKAPFKACWTTKGGVDLRQIKSNSLESKINHDLFFAGEILDATGVCGGFNLSFAMLCASLIRKNIV